MEPKRKIKSSYNAILYFISFLIFLSCQNIKEGRPYIGYGYGKSVNYGEGVHPGVDYHVAIGTPVIACANGNVVWTGDTRPGRKRDYCILINHTGRKGIYAHLSRVYVGYGESVKRGQIIGLSGEDGKYYIPHLHFGIGRGLSSNMGKKSNTLNPNKLGRNGGLPECFDPNKDYSDYDPREITLPIPCRDYRAVLKEQIKEYNTKVKDKKNNNKYRDAYEVLKKNYNQKFLRDE